MAKTLQHWSYSVVNFRLRVLFACNRQSSLISGFRIVLKDQPLTRRGIWCTISSVYDPLRIAAPLLLVVCTICVAQSLAGMDRSAKSNVYVWRIGKSQLPALERFSMEHCLKPANFGAVVSRQLHNFSDTNCTGYGQVTYVP